MEIQLDRTVLPVSKISRLSIAGAGLGILSVGPIPILLLWIILPNIFFAVFNQLSPTVSEVLGGYAILGGFLFGLPGLIIGILAFIGFVKKRKSDGADRFAAMIAMALGIVGILFFLLAFLIPELLLPPLCQCRG